MNKKIIKKIIKEVERDAKALKAEAKSSKTHLNQLGLKRKQTKKRKNTKNRKTNNPF